MVGRLPSSLTFFGRVMNDVSSVLLHCANDVISVLLQCLNDVLYLFCYIVLTKSYLFRYISVHLCPAYLNNKIEAPLGPRLPFNDNIDAPPTFNNKMTSYLLHCVNDVMSVLLHCSSSSSENLSAPIFSVNPDTEARPKE